MSSQALKTIIQSVSADAQRLARGGYDPALAQRIAATAGQAASLASDMHINDNSWMSGRDSALSARPLPDGSLRPDITTAVAFGGTPTQAYAFTWPCSGRCVGLRTYPLAVTSQDNYRAAMTALSLRVVMLGNQDLFTNGQGGAYATFQSLCGVEQGVWAMNEAFSQGDGWSVILKNDGAANYTPVVLFDFVVGG